MHRERGEDCVEGIGLVGERFEVRDDVAFDIDVFIKGEVCIAVEEGFGSLDAGELRDAFGERWGFAGWGDEVRGWSCECTGDVAAVCA